METAAQPIASSQYLRKVAAQLALCGLSRWQDVLIQFVEHYAGLEHIVDDERDGPRAAVIRLLRDISSHDLRPTDWEFAGFLAELTFLRYRVRRVQPSLTFETAELWQPLRQCLSAWKQGHDIGAYYALIPPVPLDVIAQVLLCQVQCESEHRFRH